MRSRTAPPGCWRTDLSTLAVQVKMLLDEPPYARRLGEAAQREARQRFHPTRFRRSLLSLYRLEGARVSDATRRHARYRDS